MANRYRPFSIVLAWHLVAAWMSLRTRFPNWLQMLLVYLLLALSVALIALSLSWIYQLGMALYMIGVFLAVFAVLWKIIICDAMVHASNAGPLGTGVLHGLLGRRTTASSLARRARTNAQAAGWRFPACPAYLECALVNLLASPRALSMWQTKWLEATTTERPRNRSRRPNRL